MSNFNINKNTLILIILLIINFPLEIFVHEYGHAIPVLLKGGRIERIVVFKHEIYPSFMATNNNKYESAYCFASWPLDYDATEYDLGLSGFFGAGFTMLISLIALSMLWIFNPKNIIKMVLFVFSLYILDILSYSILPLLGLPHRLFVGSAVAEPIVGLVQMGVPMIISGSLILFISAFIIWSLYKYIDKNGLLRNVSKK